MKSMVLSITTLALLSVLNQSYADGFSFDRPGLALGTAIVPAAHLSWEQALPSITYTESNSNGQKQSSTFVQTNALARIGLGAGFEARIGWDGYIWNRTKLGSVAQTEHGVGDISLGIKKSINLNDDKMAWVLLGQANLANGDEQFSTTNPIYTLGSALSYQYDKIALSMTTFYDWQDHHATLSLIPNIGYPIAGNFSGYSELAYRKPEGAKTQVLMTNGILWTPIKNMQVDASMAYDLNQDNKQWFAGLGLSYLF